MRGKKHSGISKMELKNIDPSLNPPTQNMEKNLAEGEGNILPDPDDVPSGWASTLNQQFSKRPDMQAAEEQGYQREIETKSDNKRKNKKYAKK